MKVKDVGSLGKKYATRAMAAGPDYTAGVQAAGQDWQTGAAASEASYEQGVTEAIGKKRFGKGIAAAGSAKYVDRATKLGSQRYGPGVQAAQGDWEKGFGPYAQTLNSLQLPPRAPKGSPANMQRAQVVASALRMQRVA